MFAMVAKKAEGSAYWNITDAHTNPAIGHLDQYSIGEQIWLQNGRIHLNAY